MSHQAGQLFEAFWLWQFWIDLTEFGENPRRLSHLPGGDVATMNFYWLVRIDSGQIVGFIQFPAINETVMTTRTLHVDAEKHLRNILRKLNLPRLRSIHPAPPFDAVDKPFRVRRRRDQFADKLIVGFVIDQRTIKPVGDLLAPAINVTRSHIVVA